MYIFARLVLICVESSPHVQKLGRIFSSATAAVIWLVSCCRKVEGIPGTPHFGCDIYSTDYGSMTVYI